jgi:hypothetical protein
MEIKSKIHEEAVQINDIPWKPFPDALSHGGIRWKMLHASPKWAHGPRFLTVRPARPSMRIFTLAQVNTC